jgi:hypothetical protein
VNECRCGMTRITIIKIRQTKIMTALYCRESYTMCPYTINYFFNALICILRVSKKDELKKDTLYSVKFTLKKQNYREQTCVPLNEDLGFFVWDIRLFKLRNHISKIM